MPVLYDSKGRELVSVEAPKTAHEGLDVLAGLSAEAREVQITRSFSFKLNLGNYESADFFCSQKADCSSADADEVSQGLVEFCMDEVMKSVVELKRRRTAKEEAQAAKRRQAA